MSTSQTLFDLQDGVATITLHRPERMNAWTERMGAEIFEHLLRCDTDDAVRAIVVTGAGKAFCAGADLERGGETFAEPTRERAGREALQPWQVRKPIIAAINGAAVGVGLTMPLQYDIRVAATDAKLAFLFVRRGIVTELSSTWILPRLVGIAHAADLLLTGRTLLGEEAARLGLVNEAVPAAEVLPRALAIAHNIAANCAPVSVALTKRMLWEHLGGPPPLEVAKREAAAIWALGKLPDAQEGVQSFLEKRQPRWSMSATRDLPELPAFDPRA